MKGGLHNMALTVTLLECVAMANSKSRLERACVTMEVSLPSIIAHRDVLKSPYYCCFVSKAWNFMRAVCEEA
jgi:hypothetical protein